MNSQPESLPNPAGTQDDLSRTDSPNPRPKPLQDLQDAMLTPEMLQAYFLDLEWFAAIAEVLPKYKVNTFVSDEPITLQTGRALLQGGQLHGLQIRYRFEGSTWWDTLLVGPRGIRMVRIQHDFN